MAPRLGHHGDGATVSALIKFIHPSEHIRNKFPNPCSGQRLLDCITIRQEVKPVSRKEQLTLIVHHEDFKNDDDSYIELYAVKRYWKVHKEGDSDYFFDAQAPTNEQEDEDEQRLLPDAIGVHLSGEARTTETIIALRDEVDIDDDNEPAPENVPEQNESSDSLLKAEWGHSGYCYRKTMNFGNHKAKLNFHVNPTKNNFYLQLFEGLFPTTLLYTMVDGVNETMKGERLSYGELLRWIGLWTMMSTVAGTDCHSFWSTRDIKIFSGCFFTLSTYMSRTRFELILQHIKYTKLDPPTYKDRFWEVREMLDEWNKNMATNFVPSWINCIDESMSKWLNKYTCPGFMFVPRKPWPFGNEYHDAGCADSNIIWSLELREGKDRPPQLNNKQFDDLGKTVGTLLRLTEPVWGSGKVFILDSGFCVLKAIVELQKKGIFAAALIKKRRYWPKFVPGDAIISHFVGKEIGKSDALQGEMDGIRFHLVGMKEPDYVMMFMTTYGTLGEVGDVKKRHYLENGVKCVKTFQYPEVPRSGSQSLQIS